VSDAVELTHWDRRFITQAHQVATWSKDPSTQVGVVVVFESDHDPRVQAYNGMPRGLDDARPERWDRPVKYLWVEHAERNAVALAARRGTSLLGCTAYITHPPCADCARSLIQAGIVRVVAPVIPHAEDETQPQASTWRDSCSLALDMLQEAGVICASYDK
jgi:dCMP deaminase